MWVKNVEMDQNKVLLQTLFDRIKPQFIEKKRLLEGLIIFYSSFKITYI